MIDIKITGMENVKRGLDKGVKSPLKKSLRTLASKAHRKLIAAIPRRTGKLRAGVKVSVKDLSAYVGVSSPFYGRFIEYGTVFMEPQYMAGGTRVTGTGPAAHTSDVMGNEIRQFEQEVIRAVEGLL